MNSPGSGKMFFGGYMVVVRPNDGPTTRLGVTVTRKIGAAAFRNRLKRRAREFFRLNRASWPLGLDILFIATKQASDLWPPDSQQAIRLAKFLRKNVRPKVETINSEQEPGGVIPREPH
jgi:ribonuclease P protein component